MPLKPFNYVELANKAYRRIIQTAQARIDTSPPILSINRLLKLSHLKEDAETYKDTALKNIDLLVRLNRINRTYGEVESYHQRQLKALQDRHKNAERYMRHVDVENAKFGERLLHARPLCETHNETKPRHITMQRRQRQQQEAKRQKVKPFVMPVNILRKYENLNLKLPLDIDLQRRLLRPRVYLDLAVRGSHPLGRITIQLYTEASPQVVLEFVRVCSQTPPPLPQTFSRHSHSRNQQWRNRHPQLHFIRNFPSLWLEGELKLDLNSLSERRIEYDMRALDHNSGPGILSYSSRFLRGFKDGFINFSMSYRPLSVANRRRVAFGRVCNGFKVLDCLQAYGTKNGTPRHDVCVTGCGIVPQ